MRTSTAVIDFEISGKFPEISTVDDYAGALVLFRLHGRPLGWGAASVTDGRLDRGALIRQLLEQHAWSCALPLAERAVLSGIPPRALDIAGLLQMPPQAASGGPPATVAVCSRTPASQLRPCLDSLMRLDYASVDLVLIDSSDDRKNVETFVREAYPTIRYSGTPVTGGTLRRAISECRGDILALTSGDAVVDPRWVSRLAAVFLADPEVMTVSGLALPHAIERPIRLALPAGAPFCRQWHRVEDVGTGSWQKVFERAGVNLALWHPAASLVSPYTHVFEPAAIVRATCSPVASQVPKRLVPVTHTTRSIDLGNKLLSISDATDTDSVVLQVAWGGAKLGDVHIEHRRGIVSPLWMADAIAQQLTSEVLDARLGVGEHVCRALLTADLARHVVARAGGARSAAGKSPKRPAAAA